MEFVYVVKRYDLFDLSFPHGFVAAATDSRVAAWTSRIREKGFFVERRWAEGDSSLKQIIPYTMVVHGEEAYLLRRLDTGGESRLYGKRSIGVGGHINPVDQVEQSEVLEAGCRRELDEEIAIEAPFSLSTVGVINDESQDVGSVHFGLVNVARCETNEVTIREQDQLTGEFVSFDTLRKLATTERDTFETWSSMIVDRLDEALTGNE